MSDIVSNNSSEINEKDFEYEKELKNIIHKDSVVRTIYEKILFSAISKLNILSEEKTLKNAVFLALSKTLNKIRDGNLSPAIYPIILEKDLKLDKEELAIELSVICLYFHAAADLADDVQEDTKNNTVINKYGKAQAVNIANKITFIYQDFILKLKIDNRNKLDLISIFSKSGNMMTNGQFYDLAMTNKYYFPYREETTSVNKIVQISKRKSGIEIACFTSCLMIAIGESGSMYYELGNLYGTLNQIFSDYFDIWGQNVSDDLITLKNSLPIYSASRDSRFSDESRLLLSGRSDSHIIQQISKRLLSKTEAIEELDTYFQKTKSGMSDLIEILPPLKDFGLIVNELIENCESFIDILFELRTISENDKFTTNIDLLPSIDIGLEYVKYGSLNDTWEIQRFGFLGETRLIGNINGPALVLETFLDFKSDISTQLQDLINLKGQKGWYRYTNTDKIPTDTNVLSQLLRLVARTGNIDKYKHLFSEPLSILEKNIESTGKCPIWLYDSNNSKESLEDYSINNCLGVMADLYYSLLCYDKEKYMPLISKGLEFISDSLSLEKKDFQEGAYYNFYYTFYAVSRLINAVDFESKNLNSLRVQILREQCINGSWNNSPQDTSLALLGLMTFDNIDHISLKTGAKHIIDFQNYDGSWDPENLFVCPGKSGKMIYYKNAKVTSSLCLRALLSISRKIR